MASRMSTLSFGAGLAATVCAQAATAQVGTLGRAIGHAFDKEAQILQQAQDRPSRAAEPAPAKRPAQTPVPLPAERRVVYGKAVHVNPLVTIISLLVGAELLGILGVLLAIPSAAAIQIVLREWWSAKGLDAPGLGADGVRADEGPAR